MIKKEITKKKSFQMSLALVAIGVLLVIGCPASSNSTGGPDDGGKDPTDTTDPSLDASLSVPVAGATDFPANSNIILTYSEAVLAGTGSITLTPTMPAGGTAITIAVGSAQVSVSGAVVIIAPTDDPTENLGLNTDYTLTVPAGAFMDAAGNSAAELTLSFTTAAPDTTAPTITSSVPAANTSVFLVGENIVLTYNELVQAGTGEITLTPTMPAGTAITIAVTDAQVSIAGAVVTINPTADLELSTEYTLTVPAGAIVDASGNTRVEFTLTFTTAAAADTTLPTVVSTVPAQNDTAVDDA